MKLIATALAFLAWRRLDEDDLRILNQLREFREAGNLLVHESMTDVDTGRAQDEIWVYTSPTWNGGKCGVGVSKALLRSVRPWLSDAPRTARGIR